jgi:hypothetical protein
MDLLGWQQPVRESNLLLHFSKHIVGYIDVTCVCSQPGKVCSRGQRSHEILTVAATVLSVPLDRFRFMSA